MTGFSALRGTSDGFSWAWDIRSVNAKGLDLRLRVPDWIEGLEVALRRDLGKAWRADLCLWCFGCSAKRKTVRWF